MKLNGYTQIGLITGGLIVMLHLTLIKFNLESSGFLGLQYMMLLAGIFCSIYLYNRENKLVILDLFMIGIRTMSAAIIILILEVIFFHFFKPSDHQPFTYTLMMVIFPFGMSGALSSLVSAIIVNKLLQKT